MVWGEEAGFGGVGGEFAELVGDEAAVVVGEDVLVEQVGAGRVRAEQAGSSESKVTKRPESK